MLCDGYVIHLTQKSRCMMKHHVGRCANNHVNTTRIVNDTQMHLEAHCTVPTYRAVNYCSVLERT